MEKTTDSGRWGTKMTFADLDQFALITLSTCNVSVTSQGEVRLSGLAQGRISIMQLM